MNNDNILELLGTLIDGMDRIEKKVDRLEAGLAKTNTELAETNLKVAEVDQKIADVHKKVADIHKKVAETNKEVAEIKERLILMEQDYERRFGVLFDGYAKLYEISVDIRTGIASVQATQDKHEFYWQYFQGAVKKEEKIS